MVNHINQIHIVYLKLKDCTINFWIHLIDWFFKQKYQFNLNNKSSNLDRTLSQETSSKESSKASVQS